MARQLHDFVGTYTIRHGDGTLRDRDNKPLIRPGYQLCLGTGKHHDPAPDGVRIGLSVFDPKSGHRILPAEGNPPAYAYLVDGTLNGSTYWLDTQRLVELLAYQITLLTLDQGESKAPYRSATVTITIGDPRNAGVWGAEDSGDG